jgi:hypothetical protein
VSADILVMLNIPSREGHRYALHTIDHALSKTSWAYPLKARETKVIRRFVEEDLPKLSIVLLDLVNSLQRNFVSCCTSTRPTLLATHRK